MRPSSSARSRSDSSSVVVDFESRAKRTRPSNLFIKDPISDAPYLRKNYFHKKRGLHFYFRNAKLVMQERFEQLMDHRLMPQVFLHGSPHVDNYCRNERGVAMVDFDRSRIGPYAWDLVRLMTSVIYRQKEPKGFCLAPEVNNALLAGYLKGFKQPHKPFKEMALLAEVPALADKYPVRAYFRANERWALELRTNLLPNTDNDALSILRKFLLSRGEIDLLQSYRVEAIGQAIGSMGRKRLLFYLDTEQKGRDAIFLEIKRVRQDPDSTWYHNPFAHHGQRMIAAAELYAPGWEIRQGFVTHRGVEYWGHQIPAQNIKCKDALSIKQQKDFMYCVGGQLGRAHGLSLRAAHPDILLKHLDGNFKKMCRAAEIMASEINEAYQIYLAKLSL